MIKPAFPHATLSRHPRRGILIMVNDKTLKIAFLIPEEALTINPLYRPPLKNVPLTPARAPPRRGQCVCQNEVEKIRCAYCLKPKSFGLMTPILPLRVSLEGGAG